MKGKRESLSYQKLTEQEEIELLELLEQAEAEKVSPPLEAFRSHSRIKGARGGRGAGAKCLKNGTLVWMYDGSLKKIEKINVGDLVMGQDSTPRKVLSTSKGFGQLWKVNQKSAIDYTVNDEHILCLEKAKWVQEYTGYKDYIDISIQDYLKKSERWKNHFLGYKVNKIKYKTTHVKINPYVLGIWLGDGNSKDIGITTMDYEILSAFRDYCLPFGLNEKVYDKGGKNLAKSFCFTGRPNYNPVTKIFREYSLIQNKHIPKDFMINSEHNRLELLAGLIDTDGTLRGNKSGYVFSQSDKKLSLQVKQVADSLGFRTSINKSYTKYRGENREYYRVNISGDIYRIPCRIERKKLTKEEFKRNKGWLSTQIEVIDAGFGEWSGIAIDGDHKFLLEDGTVTHNSWGLTSLIVQRAQEEKIKVACLREIQLSLQESVYSLVVDTIKRLGYSDDWNITKENIENVRTGSRFIFRGLKDLRAANQIKSLEGFDIFFVEEAATISHESWAILMPTLRKPGSELWFCYNPQEEGDPVTERFWNANRDDAILVELRPGKLDNPWWTSELQKEMEEDFKRDPDEAEHVWNGQPRKQGHKSIMSRALIRGAMDRNIEAVGKIEIGVDVARFGDDSTVMYKRKGLKVIDKKSFKKADTMFSAKEAWDFAGRDPSIPIKVDDSGVGGGVTDRLKELGAKVIPICNNESSTDKDKYDTVADEMWFEFPLSEADIPNNPKLMQELSGRQYDYDNKARRKIESKKVFKNRYGRSPDDADALLLCFYSGRNDILSPSAKAALRARRNR